MILFDIEYYATFEYNSNQAKGNSQGTEIDRKLKRIHFYSGHIAS